jgi:hypothetical protein
MPTIQTTYPQGGVSTSSEGQQLTQGNDLSGVLAEVLRRRLAMQQQVQQGPMLGRAPVQQQAPVQPAMPRPEPKSALERAQEHAAILRLKAAEQAPWRYTYGSPNAPSHPEIPIEFLNAYQRQLYLPNAAGMSPGLADTRGDGEDDSLLWSPDKRRFR